MQRVCVREGGSVCARDATAVVALPHEGGFALEEGFGACTHRKGTLQRAGFA